MSYLDATNELYKAAALSPDVGLCCTTNPIWALPGLEIPRIMQDMNYGCGSTVNPRDLINAPTILYVGVGGGMELLQFSYFSRRKGGVIGVDVLPEMLEASKQNFLEAEKLNAWFNSDYIDLRIGDALNLPITNSSVDLVAQNCVFNIFKLDDLKKALTEVYRVLKPNGKLVMSDPICEQEMPEELRNDDRLRAMCLTGAIPLKDYLEMITSVGFGTVEVRAKRAYRVLDPKNYPTKELLVIESIEVCAIKDPMPLDGPCIFTGKTAIYYGSEPSFDDNKGHFMMKNQPIAICDKTGEALLNLNRGDIYISASNFHYDGGGCC